MPQPVVFVPGTRNTPAPAAIVFSSPSGSWKPVISISNKHIRERLPIPGEKTLSAWENWYSKEVTDEIGLPPFYKEMYSKRKEFAHASF